MALQWHYMGSKIRKGQRTQAINLSSSPLAGQSHGAEEYYDRFAEKPGYLSPTPPHDGARCILGMQKDDLMMIDD